jgi:outer membrane protein OmpA-like peptidoglycan-associated protein
MKNKHLFAFALALIALNFNVIGRSPLNTGNSNYVVIGAFSMQSNAKHFAENAKKLSFSAELAINPTRNLFYVYVLHTGDSSVANAQARKLRTETPFNDTWVYRGLLGADAQDGTDVNPITEQKIVQVEVADNTLVNKATLAEQKNLEAEISKTTLNKVESESMGKIDEVGAKGFVFKITSVSGQELKGEVDLIDTDRLAKVAEYEGNKLVGIKPLNKSGKLMLICEVLGYRKVQRELNYNLPDSSSGVTLENGNTIVPFEMIRLRKGDIAVMYNVLFFKDAAVMRPDSHYEVNSLKEMMEENPKYKIKIHGHTNGNSAGKIIRMGENKNFFSLTGSKDGFGSAKELSESRAEVIRDFLISEGIDPGRLLVKAWGGKKAIHDKKSSKAHENVRVEVEILED